MASANVSVEGERRSTPPSTSRILLVTGGEFAVRHSVIDGYAIFEGDIILGRPFEAQGTVIKGPGARWPNKTIVYDVDDQLPDKGRVDKALQHWRDKTGLTFRQATASDSDYVLFKSGHDCGSAIGRIRGVQFIFLGPDCTDGNAIHEIGHTVGLWHEQSRSDRDRFITIKFDNIDPDKQHNFDQHITDGDNIGDYDYGSIMHYPATAFAIDPTKPTIVTPHGEAIGQRVKLSDGDIAAVRAIYP